MDGEGAREVGKCAGKRENVETSKERKTEKSQRKCARECGYLSFRWMKSLRASTFQESIGSVGGLYARSESMSTSEREEKRHRAGNTYTVRSREGDDRSRAVEVTLWLFDPAVPAN